MIRKQKWPIVRNHNKNRLVDMIVPQEPITKEKHMTKRSNTEIVLRALEKGVTVDIGLHYPIFLDYDNSLVYEYTKEDTVPCDISLTKFIYRCNNLTEAERISIVTASVLRGEQ